MIVEPSTLEAANAECETDREKRTARSGKTEARRVKQDEELVRAFARGTARLRKHWKK